MKISDKFNISKIYPYIQDLNQHLGREVELIVKVESKRLQISKDQKKFLLLTFSDRTGSVRAVDWYNAENNDSFIKTGDVVLVKGKVVYFEDRLQINISKEPESVSKLEEGEFPSERFVEKTEKDIDSLFAEAMKLISTIKDRDLLNLTRTIFLSLEKEIKHSPAGMRVHHAYIGGLLEHSLTVAKIADYVSKFYIVNRDLLISGALLHDIGKVKEYRITPTGINVTTEGELKGHIIIGIEIVKKFAERLKLKADKIIELQHIIASHHGEMELGSPVLPKTPEAMIIHFIENMDSKIARFMDIIKKSDDNKEWSEYDRNLGRRIFLRNSTKGD
ncbi:MAG: HD domain-containing protein [Thermotogaceae bacterium]|nr:HD domain-containing protein [Thermotogaceae bacterium]